MNSRILAPLALRRAAAAAILLLAAQFAAAETLLDPRKPGPHPVGVTTMTLVDHSRTDPLTKGPRTLLTEIWYPAADDEASGPKNRFSDHLLRGANAELNEAVRKAFDVEVAALDARFKNTSIRDARIRDGKFPLLVFSHGNGGIRNQSTFWCEHMASHGYIVMSADHTGNCAMTVVDGKVVSYSAARMMNSSRERPVDVSFLITRMDAMSRGEDSRFAARVDMENVGVAGHSYGGLTAAAVMDDDPRVKAIAPMTPVWPKRKNFTTPVLMFLATEDATIGVAGNKLSRKRFDETKGPHYLVEIVKGGHFSFTDMEQIKPDFGDGIGKGKMVTSPGEEIVYLPVAEVFEITNAYSTAFFGLYLKGQKGYQPYLNVNHYGEKIVHLAFPDAAPAAPPAKAGGDAGAAAVGGAGK